MKKVLLIDRNFYNYRKSIAYEIERMGLQVKELEVDIPLTLIIRIYNMIMKHIFLLFKCKREHQLLAWQVNKISEQIYKTYCEYSPDIIIVIKGDYLSNKVCKSMKNSQKILWMMDSFSRYPYLIKLAESYNKVFTFEKSDILLLSKYGINAQFLPLCADEKIYYPQNMKKEIDILFIGAMYPERKKFFDKLIRKFPQYNVQIYGYNINKFELIKKFKYNIMSKYKNYNRSVSPEKANELYAKSKICMNMHNCQSKLGTNPRTFEILASQSFELVDFNEYIKEKMEDGVIIYNSFEDACEKIEYYMKHEKERNKIASIGYNISISEHLFKNRVSTLIGSDEWYEENNKSID